MLSAHPHFQKAVPSGNHRCNDGIFLVFATGHVAGLHSDVGSVQVFQRQYFHFQKASLSLSLKIMHTRMDEQKK